jgi:PAS domain S-box-containing protein
MVGKTDFELFPKEVAEKFVADDQAVLTTGQALLNREEYYLDAQGGQRWMLTSKLPLSDEHGRIIGLVGIGHDITERRRAEARLRLLSRAVEQSPASIIITDPQGCIEYVNPKFSEVSGYTLQEVRGKTPRILKSELTAPEVYVRLWQTITSGRVWQGEFCNRRKNGSLFWEAASISAVTDANGLVTHFVGVKEDITEMKRAEEELRRAKEAAEAASRAKSEFLANMSHEIRTPMNGVIGMTGLLLDTELADEQREYAETIRHSGETLLALINDVLDFSKIEAGRLDLEILDFDLRSVVEDAAEILALRAQQKGLEFICLIEPQVPALLQGDPGRLRQVLTNLAGNAIKFTTHGEVSIRVGLEAASGERATLRFDVDDTGIGIPPGEIDKLFTPFTQVETSTTRRFGGTGLGLSISKRLVELMGGSIGVESCEGRGSSFWFKAVFGLPSVPAQLAWKPAPGIAGKRALVVDDNATNRRLLTVLLGTWGCDFDEAADGSVALEKLRAARTAGRSFDLALLDMHMPEMDGEELGRQIKADPALADLPLVMLTSLSERGHADRLREIGFAGCLTKPLKQSQLYHCIALVLAHEQSLPEELPRRFVTGQILPPTSQRKCRILLAEDNVTNQKVALRILEKMGYRADAVANGREVVRALETIPYALVLMDCQMPEMDGYEATRVIRDAASRVRSHDIPVIAMTAYAMQGDREKCLAAGMNDYISKPVQPGELAETLARWLVGGEPDAMTAAPAPSETPNAAKEVFDEADLLRRLMGDMEVVRSISGVFVEEAARNIASLQNALETFDLETASHLAHSIKGSSANLGARSLRETAASMEKLLVSGDAASASVLLPQLIDRFATLKRAMHRLLSGDGDKAG